MIFISGIHGVGKTFFCNKLKQEMGINCHSASKLITSKRNKEFSDNKLVPDIDDNQPRLIESIKELRESENEFILDGHFCLLNEVGNITRIPSKTFTLLQPNLIVLLTEKPEIIAERRSRRDHIEEDLEKIAKFQDEEKKYAIEISNSLNIPLIVSNGASDIEEVIMQIKYRR